MNEHQGDTAPSASPTEASGLNQPPTQVPEHAEPLDQIDRSIVMAESIKTFAMWALRLLVIAAFVYMTWQLLKQVGQGVLPIAFAIIVCTVLAPPTSWMRHKGLPNALAALISILGFFGAFGTLIWLIAPNIASQSQVLYLQAFEGVQHMRLWAQGPPLNLESQTLDNMLNEFATWLQNQAGAIAGGIVSGVSTATSFVITLSIILVLTFFFLKDGHRFLPWGRKVAGRRLGWHMTESLTRGWNTLGGYIRAQALVSLIDAFFITAGLLILDVPIALALGVITFMAGFIPYVGAIVAGALSVLVALVSLGFTEAMIVLAIVLAVQQLEGNVLSPWLQSKAMSLHPVIILVSVIIGGGLFGLVGSFLAVPVAAMIAIGLRYLLDMTSLRAGEKLASEIEFVTPEGKMIGKIAEDEGRLLREQWRNSVVYVEDPDEQDLEDKTPDNKKHDTDDSDKEAPPQASRAKTRGWNNPNFEQLLTRFGRR
ncbi:AI-2E family transporter [Corynebacterium alimapuense]|uniref:AI-2E family transporter n=1 Tax=Corynebacterium alimapuense TaxID=1576874 RepID=A0A3M8K6W7_9CORY|nr:AI-2E family transporter [Corynebacterium alimapuense]RNE48505.1 AI-2E family transporter [Corynebacterium alimapuense]